MSPLVVSALSAHLAAYGIGQDGLVFHYRGRPIGRAMAVKHMRTACTYVQLAGRGLHDLRHHHALVPLLSEGVSPALIAERLRDDVKTLLSTDVSRDPPVTMTGSVRLVDEEPRRSDVMRTG